MPRDETDRANDDGFTDTNVQKKPFCLLSWDPDTDARGATETGGSSCCQLIKHLRVGPSPHLTTCKSVVAGPTRHNPRQHGVFPPVSVWGYKGTVRTPPEPRTHSSLSSKCLLGACDGPQR